MGTTADKLEKVLETKGRIAGVLEGRGIAVEGLPFSDYPDLLPGEAEDGDREDPEHLYRTLRPAEWMALPEPGEGEEVMYLLMLLVDGPLNLVALTVECDGQYTVEWGETADGVFSAEGRRAVDSGDTFAHDFAYADWPGHAMENGLRQVVLRLTGTNIRSFAPGVHEARNYSLHKSWYIVDMWGRLPRLESLSLGGPTAVQGLAKLWFFALEGENRVERFYQTFCYCYCLVAVRRLYTGRAVDFSNMFSYSPNVRAVCDLDTSRGTVFSYMFASCGGLTRAPRMDLRGAVDIAFMFYFCNALRWIPPFNGASPVTATSAFSSCASLLKVEGLDLSNMTAAAGMFASNFSLRSVEFTGENPDFPAALSVNNAHMDGEALGALLESLPALNVERTVSILNNPGTADVPEDVLERVRAKNWAVQG